ncbi:hypothetical protein Tco_1004527 [Tanacetum coccineum]|uniref:Uncharacterized protein n=1 Tax=Tanacetum coccineum TaxID=301880 RepID=A0ABQ5FD99_9ASTR
MYLDVPVQVCGILRFSLELVAYTDSDYAGATLDRKSTTGGCQFLGNRLISWQCKKQTVVATSTTEAEYVATASCYGQQFWRSVEASTDENGDVKINATIDGHTLSITEGSLRRHLKLADQDGITSLPTTEIFEQLALMGYHTDSDNPHKFLMYPRFIQICLDMQRHQLQQHTRIYPVSSLSMKVFSNMKRSTNGFSGQEVALFPNMLDVSEPSTSPSRITSSPSPTPSPDPTPAHTPSPTQPSPTQPSPTQPSLPTSPTQPLTTQNHHQLNRNSKHIFPTPLTHDPSMLIEVLEADLIKTKKTYSSAYTKLIFRVKKLESQIKIGKARRQARVVLSDDEAFEDNSSKQGRKLSDEEVQEKASTDTELLIQEVTLTEVIQDPGAEANINGNKRAQIARDEEIARQWDEEERKRVMDEAKSTKKID